MYQIGDKVVYPMHGAGIIKAIEEKEILGKKQQYYIIHIPSGNMTLMIPVLKSDDIGVRYIIDKSEGMKVLETFRNCKIRIDSNWNKRYRDNMEKIKSADIYQVVEVVKDLMYRDKVKGLSTSDRKMLNNAKQIVVSELVMTNVAEREDIESIMDDTISEITENQE
jgi:CarD family transcriptional regulator